MKKQPHLDTYTTVYPIDIVVANEYVTAKQLQELFTYSDGSEIEDSFLDKSYTATTVGFFRRRSDGKLVSFIVYLRDTDVKTDIKADRVNTYAHEAAHAAMDIFKYIGATISSYTDDQEAFAYLIGYIAECIYKTVNKK